MKKRSVSIDARSEPSAPGSSSESSANYRVDRVYPVAPRARSSSPNLPTVNLAEVSRPSDPDLSRQIIELKKQLAATQQEFDETRALWSAERHMLEEKARAELEQSRQGAKVSTSNEVRVLEAGHATELAQLRSVHDAELDALRENFEVELAELRGTVELDALDAQTFAGERQRMALELEDARTEALRDASEREKTYAQEAELLLAHHEAELARRDDQIIALRQDVAALKLRCATLEGESNRWALERLRYIAHLEEGLVLLGAARPDDEEPLDIEVKRGDDDDDDE